MQPPLPDFCLQTRLYTAYMFSDDPAFIAVGVNRAILALRIWRRRTDDVGLLMAMPEKRALGSHAWLLYTAHAGDDLPRVVPAGRPIREDTTSEVL